MTPQNEFLLILGMMLVTFGTRYPIMALLSKRQLPDQFKLALEYVPPAVLVAIIVPEVLAPSGDLYLSFSNSALAARNPLCRAWVIPSATIGSAKPAASPAYSNSGISNKLSRGYAGIIEPCWSLISASLIPSNPR